MYFRFRRIKSKLFSWNMLTLICVLIFISKMHVYKKKRKIKYGGIDQDSMPTDFDDVSQRMQTRHLLQNKVCENFQESQKSDEDNFLSHLQFVPDHNMVYCGIEKVGSTFWRRTIQLLYQKEVGSPYSINPEKSMDNYKSFKNSDIVDYTSILNNNTIRKFLFVRDPYSRLLSGYTDKLFSPNSYFWMLIGRKAVRYNRKGIFKTCGHDLTFEEFINYFIHTEEQNKGRDGHFLPATDHCRPCSVKYDFIGKMETFVHDARFIFEQYDLHSYAKFFENFTTDAVNDAMYDTAQAFYAMQGAFLQCISFENGLKRIWRKLQIRGIIADEVNIPKEVLSLSRIKKNELFDIISKAHAESLSYNLKQQKKKYLINAFSNIPIITMNKLVNIFKNDFRIFGYDPKPMHLFQPRNKFKSINIFAV